MSTELIIDTSTHNFKKLFDLTKETCVIPEEVNYDSIVQKKTERWDILLEIWRGNKKIVGANIFSVPLYHIIYGFDFCRRGQKVIELLREVEKTLLTDNEAFNVWVHTDMFKRAYKGIVDKSGGLIEYINFLNASGTLRLLRGKNIAKLSRTKKSKPYYLLEREYHIKNQQYYDEFKKLFGKILPESIKWSDKQWMKYSYIYDCLNNTYGVDFHSYYSCLNPIYYLLKYSVNLPCHVDIDEIVKAPFNYSLVKAISPANADDMIYKLFSMIGARYKANNWLDELNDSWIVKILYQWAYDPEHKYYREARKAIIDLTMTK